MSREQLQISSRRLPEKWLTPRPESGLVCVIRAEYSGQGAGGLVFKAHRLFYLSTLGSRVTKKKKRVGDQRG